MKMITIINDSFYSIQIGEISTRTLAVKFPIAVKNDRSSGHIHAHGKGLSGNEDLRDKIVQKKKNE